MTHTVPFETVLAYLQEHGWEFQGIWKPYRVFKKRGHAHPILIKVVDKMVDIEYVARAKQIIEAEHEQGGEESP